MFDVEISTSRPLFQYDISILSVWVNQLIIHKCMILYQKPKTKNKKQGTKININTKHMYYYVVHPHT